MSKVIKDPRPWFAAKLLALALPRFSSLDGQTAFAGGGQTNATPITKSQVRFTTVATIADSSIMPPALPGYDITVINSGAQSMNIFPAVGEQINGTTANTAYALAAGKTAMFFSAVAGQWHAILSA